MRTKAKPVDKPKPKRPPRVPGAPKQKTGPKPLNPTPEQRQAVEMMIAAGIIQDHIASALGISDVTLRKYYPDEIANGMTRVNARVVNKLLQACDAGEVGAIKFWLQARMGWSDKTTLVDDRPPQTRVVIELVGSPAGKTIDHQPQGALAGLRNQIEFVGKANAER